MKLLVDTHLLLWAALSKERLSQTAQRWMADPDSELYFSPVCVWEVAIKRGARPGFTVDPQAFLANLLNSGYQELLITSQHALEGATLPLLHRDPFDRILIAQARSEGMTLLTADREISRYPGRIILC